MNFWTTVFAFVCAIAGHLAQEDITEEAGLLPRVRLDHQVFLDQYNIYLFRWSPLKTEILIQVEVKTHGYVGLGFSPDGQMKGADIVLGWIDDRNIVHLNDRFAHGAKTPQLDQSQDYHLVGGYKNDTHVILRFTRPWKTCDVTHDFQLSGDTTRVIWAYHSAIPTGTLYDRIKRHDHRGVKSIYLLEPPVRINIPPETSAWDVTVPNVKLPSGVDTLYWCKLYKIPDFNTKQHMIGYIPLIEETNKPHVHHMLLYECHLQDGEKHFEKWIDLQGTQCYSKNMPISWSACNTPILAWAIGSEGEMLPDRVGLPLGENHGGSTYFLLEIHYDNPEKKEGIVDNSGVRIFYTRRLREHVAGILSVGHKVEPTQIIPPGRTWKSVAHCTADCTKYMLPDSGIRVFSGILHSHLLAHSLKLQHIRKGKEMPPIFEDYNYDFNYQQTRILFREKTVLPGDHLITVCGYNATRRSLPTFGGFSTSEEMCLIFIHYYPKIDFGECYSRPDFALLLYTFGIDNLYDNEQIIEDYINEDDEMTLHGLMSNGELDSLRAKDVPLNWIFRRLRISEPKSLKNKTFHEVLFNDTVWQNEALMKTLQDNVRTGQYEPSCLHNGRISAYGLPKKAKYPRYESFRRREDQCTPSPTTNDVQIPPTPLKKDFPKAPYSIISQQPPGRISTTQYPYYFSDPRSTSELPSLESLKENEAETQSLSNRNRKSASNRIHIPFNLLWTFLIIVYLV